MSVEVAPARAEVPAGGTADLVFTVNLENGWHIYGIDNPGIGKATSVVLEEASPFALEGKLEGPKPKHHPAEGEYVPAYDYYEGEAVFRARLRVPAGAAAGQTEVKGMFEYQECTNKVCLPPGSVPFSVVLKIVPGGKPATANEPAPPAAARKPAPSAPAIGGAGFLGFLGLAISAGILTLLTPCVFPLIPVTISYFLKQSTENESNTFLLCGTYGLGIMGSFTALGFGLTMLMDANAARAFAANPYVNLVIGALFVFFAFSLLGAFELRLPAFVSNRLNFMGRGGYGGALFLGLTFAVTAFACTAPFASAVILAAVQGHYFWSVLGMLVYSGTMALPFFVLGLFPRLLQSLPRSGGWMNSVKVVFGFFELAAAFKFLANTDWGFGWGFLNRPIVLSIWVICAAFTCLYLLQVFLLPHDARQETVGVARVTFALLFGTFAIYLSTGLSGKALPYIDGFLPLRQATMGPASSSPGREEAWQEVFFEEGLARAKKEGKPLIVDMTAFT